MPRLRISVAIFCLLGKAVIEPVDQDVGINESGHVRRDPLFSSPGREAACRTFRRWTLAVAFGRLIEQTEL